MHNHHLEKMGITEWQLRTKQTPELDDIVWLAVLKTQKSCLFLLAKPALRFGEDDAMQLLQKICRAVTPDVTIKEMSGDVESVDALIVLGEDLRKVAVAKWPQAKITVVPSLEAMLQDPNAKRETWSVLKPFSGT